MATAIVTEPQTDIAVLKVDPDRWRQTSVAQQQAKHPDLRGGQRIGSGELACSDIWC